MNCIYLAKINKELSEESFNALLQIISKENQDKCHRFKFKEDALRTLYGELIVRHVLSDYFSIENKDIKILKSNEGKPYIKDNPIYFNISHAGDFVVCAFSEQEIGVDIEQINDIDLKIAKRFFCASEYEDLVAQEVENRLDYFYSLWTLKESYMKWLGTGISIPLDSFCFKITGDEISFVDYNRKEMPFFKQYFIDGYKLSVCSMLGEFSDEIVKIDPPKDWNLTQGYVPEIGNMHKTQKCVSFRKRGTMKKKLLILLLLLLAILFANTAITMATPRQTPSGLDFEEMKQQLDLIMNEYVGVATPGAAVVVIYDGKIIFSRGYGYADLENQIPVDPNTTVFEYASISKTFVWVLVMQLVEQGLLDLDEDINTYLPDDFVFDKPFTMRDLLNHAAGFEEVLLDIVLDARNITRSTQTLTEGLLSTQPRQIFTPSMISAYSNWDASLAAFVVEQIIGENYATIESNNILIPLGMQNTLNQPDWLGNDAFLANKANGYTADGEGSFNQTMWSYLPGIFPSGGLNGTAQDLAKFVMALTPPVGEAGLLFEDVNTLATIFTSSSLEPGNLPGTYHGFLATYGDIDTSFGHGGSLPGFNTDFALIPEERFGYVILTNSYSGYKIFPKVRELLLGGFQTDTNPITNNLPNTEVVKGRFITARRVESNFLTLFAYVATPMMQIMALDENMILVSLGSLTSPTNSAVYIQTEPYIYRLYDYDSIAAPAFSKYYSKLRFSVVDGVPQSIHVGNGLDYTALPPGRTMPLLITSLITTVSSIVFFIIMPVILNNYASYFDYFIARAKEKEK